jgi:beta-lactamase regulating signal transducer with metallopeptidase domain
MIGFIGTIFPGTNVAIVVALDVAIKATALLLMTYGAHFALGRRRVLARSALWCASLIGLLLLPLASLTFPRLPFAVLPTEKSVSTEAFLPGQTTAIQEGAEVVKGTSKAATGVLNASIEVEGIRASDDVKLSGALEGPTRRLGGAMFAISIYLGVAILLAIRLVAAIVAASRLVGRCEAVVRSDWARSLEDARRRLGIRRFVMLLESDRVSVPLTVGWFRPAIILPATMPRTATPGIIDMALLHELAHVRRGDFAWNVVCKLVRLIYWPLPVVWPLDRTLGAVREQACDDLCVYLGGSAAAYRDLLLAVAATLVVRPELSLGVAMARATNLSRRLAWIDLSPGKSQCLLGLTARLGLTIAVLTLTGALGASELKRQSSGALEAGAEVTQPRVTEIVVVAKDSGKRLPGAKVSFSIDFGTSLREANRDGVVHFDLTKRVFQDSLNFDVWADGYVQQRFFFAQNDARYPKIPDRFTVELLPGEETLGGKVTDEQGRPIAGVKVTVWGYLGEKKDKHELAYMVDVATDEKGQWRCRCFRSMTFAYLYLSHPDYLSDDEIHPRRHGQPAARGKPARGEALPTDEPLARLKDFSDVQTMTLGTSLAGIVIDEHEKPIAGAEVAWFEGDGRAVIYYRLPFKTTDARGYFRFPHVRPGKLTVQVKAKGHAPEIKPLDAIDMAGHLTVKLTKPQPMTGRVVDSAGKPIPDAFVNVDTWRGYRSLGVFLKTDTLGRFRWDDAPPEKFLINVSKTGFAGITFLSVSPDQQDLTLNLKRSLSISGQIKDAVTDKPIEQTEVEVGSIDATTGEIVWARDQAVFAFQGRLQGSVDVENKPELRLRISASGYEPAVSRVFRKDENQVEYDVKLKKAQ